jgi:hypothetical protein
MHGNSRTNPNGIEIDEFPFNRIRLRKKDNAGSAWAFSLLKSSAGGGFSEEGIRLTRPCTKPMTPKGFLPIRMLFRPQPAAMQLQFVVLGLPPQSEKLIFAVSGPATRDISKVPRFAKR